MRIDIRTLKSFQELRMSTQKTRNNVWLVLPVALGLASMAFAGDELPAAAKKGRGTDPLFLTATNGANNFLAVVNTRTKETNYVPTGGLGGAGGNAGGVAVDGDLAAV